MKINPVGLYSRWRYLVIAGTRTILDERECVTSIVCAMFEHTAESTTLEALSTFLLERIVKYGLYAIA